MNLGGRITSRGSLLTPCASRRSAISSPLLLIFRRFRRDECGRHRGEGRLHGIVLGEFLRYKPLSQHTGTTRARTGADWHTHRLTVSRSPPGGILGMISLDCPVFLSLHNHPAFTEDLLSHRFYGVDAPTRPPRVELVSKKFHLRPCGIPSARGSDHFGLFNVLTPLSHTPSHYFFPSLSIYPTLLQK